MMSSVCMYHTEKNLLCCLPLWLQADNKKGLTVLANLVRNAVFVYNLNKTAIHHKMLRPQTHLYIVKPGFTEVYIIFLISVQNKDCGYLLEPPRRF